MANADYPKGLMPIRHRNGAPFNGALNHYATATGDSTALFIGDPVKIAGGSAVINGVTYGTVTRAATGDVVLGSVVAVLPITESSTK